MRKSRFVFGLVAASTIALSGAALSVPFRNGDFVISGSCAGTNDCFLFAPSQALTGWSVSSGSIDECKCWQSSPLGGLGLDLDGLTPGSINQTFSTKVNQKYRVTLYLAGNPGSFDPSELIKTMNVSVGSFSGSLAYNLSAHASSFNNMNYVATAFEFTASSNSSQLTFASKDQPSSGYGPVIGNVAVTALPADGEFQVHGFTGASVNGDGAVPTAQLVPGTGAVLYGTSQSGGANTCPNGGHAPLPCGTVFSLTPNADGTAWTEQTLLSFDQNAWSPSGRLTYYKASNMLYGSALYGGGTGCGGLGCGAVYQLTAATGGANATKTVIFTFQGGSDGGLPNAHLLQDQTTGVLYGTARQGGNTGCGGSGCGVVFRLTPPVSGTHWTETVLYTFTGGADGANPVDINLDSSGNLYGTTAGGGAAGKGTVFKLTEAVTAPWAETVLHSFASGNDGAVPGAGVVLANTGALFGTTSQGGDSRACNAGCGTVFQLSPTAKGNWAETVLYRFRGLADGQTPLANLITGATATTLYGTTSGGGSKNCPSGCGTVFKLTAPAPGSKTWTEKILHAFTGKGDGSVPKAGLHADAAGKLYGTTASGGADNLGTAFQLQ